VYSCDEIVKVGRPTAKPSCSLVPRLSVGTRLNLVVEFEARRIECDSVSGRTDASKQMVIRIRSGKIALSY